jgi:tRNA (cytidine/uridine-2'-O-)-methyltransferase
MLHVALWQPEIPPNTGNIARLCVGAGLPLHLIGRVGFQFDDRSLRRASIDYWSEVALRRHSTLEDFEQAMVGHRIFCFSSHATTPYTNVQYQAGDCLLFGSESQGLPADALARHRDRVLCIPMPASRVRSLNLSTAVGIVVYEGLRQLHAW